METIIL